MVSTEVKHGWAWCVLKQSKNRPNYRSTEAEQGQAWLMLKLSGLLVQWEIQCPRDRDCILTLNVMLSIRNTKTRGPDQILNLITCSLLS